MHDYVVLSEVKESDVMLRDIVDLFNDMLQIPIDLLQKIKIAASKKSR